MNDVNDSIIAIVLNWNQIETTKKCLESLYAQKEINLDILLIDNHSNYFPIQSLKKEFPKLKIIILTENKGVAGGRNEGLRYALKNNFNYALIFDNDAIAHSYMVVNLKNLMNRSEGIGITGPKIYRDDRKNIIWRAGCLSWRSVYLYSWFSILKKYYQLIEKPMPSKIDLIRGEGREDDGRFEKEIEIDFQIGCAQLIDLGIVQKIGYLDERFSPYGSEDIDFCERAKKNGWKIKYVPQAVCWHNVISKPAYNPQRTYHNLKNIILLARKHLSRKEMLFCFIPDFMMIHLPLMLFDNAVKGADFLKAAIDAVKWHVNDIKINGFFKMD